MEQATTIGLDIAKHVFQVHGTFAGAQRTGEQLCAKVAVSNCHQRRRPWSRLP